MLKQLFNTICNIQVTHIVDQCTNNMQYTRHTCSRPVYWVALQMICNNVAIRTLRPRQVVTWTLNISCSLCAAHNSLHTLITGKIVGMFTFAIVWYINSDRSGCQMTSQRKCVCTITEETVNRPNSVPAAVNNWGAAMWWINVHSLLPSPLLPLSVSGGCLS